MVKLKADNLETYKPIDSPTVTDVAGVPYDTLGNIKNVQHLAQLDDANAVILTGKPGPGPAYAVRNRWTVNLQTIALP